MELSGSVLFLVLAVGAALVFEFVNGFHDTANAVATVIYTRSLKSHQAVIFSGLLNFAGVMLAGVGVAYSIVNLFPLESLLALGSEGSHTVALVFSVLASAITWNLGTWYFGIPASSSHALIGSIIGASMGYCLETGLPLEQGVPWDKARQIMAALFISPLLGFAAAGLMLKLAQSLVKDPALYRSPEGENPPPWWIRCLLVATCGGVSFAHGSNDGQKGMGLIMLILIGLAPASYSLNSQGDPALAQRAQVACVEMADRLPRSEGQLSLEAELKAYLNGSEPPAGLRQSLIDSSQTWSRPLSELKPEERVKFRQLSTLQVKCLKKLAGDRPELAKACTSTAKAIESNINYVSDWVKLSVALALGLGTMVGWKRIVVTVGEKIGKSHLTYAQGGAAELVAASTILIADLLKMPVSTTHVLSSGVAGTMAAQGSGLQSRTCWTIAMAWILTLPVCISLATMFYLALSRL